jgi:ferredoxin
MGFNLKEGLMAMIEAEGFPPFDAQPGRKLVLAIKDGGVDISHRCGGNARCTTCRVEIIKGDVESMGDAEHARLSREVGLAPNVRLACQIRVPDHELSLKVGMRASEKGWDPGTVPAE